MTARSHQKKKAIVGAILALLVAASIMYVNAVTPDISEHLTADTTVSGQPGLPHAGTGADAALAPSAPVAFRLHVPSAGVDADVRPVGLSYRGNMAVLASYSDVAWYQHGPAPGESGNAVLAGHVDNGFGLPGVFSDLAEVNPGDHVYVEGGGERRVFTVTSVVSYPTAEAPTEEIFSTHGPSQIVLITCDGAWDSERHSYDRRVVVYASLAA